MRRLFILTVAILFSLLVGTAYAGNVNLTAAWDQTDYERVDRWVIFYSTASGGPYSEIGTLTKAEAEAGGVTKEFILGSPDGEKIIYFFVVRAYDDDNGIESGYSNEADHEVDFTAVLNPTTLTVTIKITSQ